MRTLQLDAAIAANCGRPWWRRRFARKPDVQPVPTALGVDAVAEIVDTLLTGWKHLRKGDRAWRLERPAVTQRPPSTVKATHPPGVNMAALFGQLARDCAHIVDTVELIGATTTKAGLKVESALDTRSYQKGIKVSKAVMKCLDITGDQFHPEWNYTIRPRLTAKS
jgi:hypothetical protein